MKPLTLALAGLEQDDITDFRRVFGKLRSQLEADWRLVDDADADLTVIDIDSIYGHMDWLKLTGSGMRTAVYTSAQYTKESDLVLFKPLQTENLADVLNVVAGELGAGGGAPTEVKPAPPAAKPAGAKQKPEPVSAESPDEAIAPQSTPNPEQGISSPAVVPESREVASVKAVEAIPDETVDDEADGAKAVEVKTVGACLLDGAIEKPVRIAVEGEAWTIDPGRSAYHGPAKLKPFSSALEQSADQLRKVDVLELEKIRKGAAQPISRLRWFAGLMASPGKLNPALVASQSYKLARWPQIEREFPRHFRIATAMMKQAGSVGELSQASGAPEPDVIDFINACHAIGIVEYTGGANASVEPPQGGVMSRLRSSLGR